jgi:hypothetical protein
MQCTAVACKAMAASTAATEAYSSLLSAPPSPVVRPQQPDSCASADAGREGKHASSTAAAQKQVAHSTRCLKVDLSGCRYELCKLIPLG